MFGSLGVPEMIVIFVLALVLFGPKKLPEIGRTVGKAITEFRRASSELKDTFRNEMQQLEQEAAPLKEAAKDFSSQYQDETYNYNYDYSYDSQVGESSTYSSETNAAQDVSSESASATQGAELTTAGSPDGETPQDGDGQIMATNGQGETAYPADEPAVEGEPPVSAEQKA